MQVAAIHDERGYRKIKRALSKHYDTAYRDADIQIVDVDLVGDRKLMLTHRVLDGIVLEESDAEKVLQHVADLWGYDVKLVEQDDNGVVRAEHSASPRRPFM
jgi:spore cortex formation protein SpoVR/YcgB (stage V sporulation)